MLIRLRPDSAEPVYLQIAEAVSVQIGDGSILPGDRLPSARVLAETLGVNMHTVLKAYSHLESMGQVDKRRGRGGVVVTAEESLRTPLRTLIESAKRQGVSRSDVVSMLDEEW